MSGLILGMGHVALVLLLSALASGVVYRALYGIGLVLEAFFAGTAVNGDGLLAAFFAGLAVTLFNVLLCECFMDYGTVTGN